MPLQETSGAASYDAFGGGTPVPANYIEDVFSTFLYTGTAATRSINNGIDLATNGGLTWIKNRTGTATNHFLFDTNRGALNELNSNTTDAQASLANSLTSFNSNGFSLGNAAGVNTNAVNYASWSFRKQPKFFDVVTWTGTGGTGVIQHNLGSTPGCIILKRVGLVDSWWVVHRSGQNAFDSYARLDLTGAFSSGGSGVSNVNDTSFTVSSYYNGNGTAMLAYVFAHNAGGFGDSNTDNVISCGSYTGNGQLTGPSIDLGYEPQWIMIKNRDGVGNWQIIDSMRGLYFNFNEPTLQANLIDAETSVSAVRLLANGFRLNSTSTEFNASADVYIYIAIRRGLMKTPTSGSTVLGITNRSGTNVNATVTGLPVTDAVLIKNTGAAVGSLIAARLNNTGYFSSSSSGAEITADATILQANPWDAMNGIEVGTTSAITNASSNTFINYLFRRAPKFMDVVYYIASGSAGSQEPHNLNAVPELMIIKNRAATGWFVYYGDNASFMGLQSNSAGTATNAWNNTTPTSSVFTLGTNSGVNTASGTYFAWLFASCPGVSKVGTFTGTGATQVIDCGFTSGARFVIVKSISAVGSWYIWDSVRGIVAGNDPYFIFNSNAAQVTNTDWVDTAASGFELSNAAGNLANSSGVSYVFLAIA